MKSVEERVPVYGIDLIRFIAAMLVMLYHFSAKPFLTPKASTLNAVLGGLEPLAPPPGMVWWGWIGVQIFFVISGAVISYSASGATPRSFFIGRVARLWPAMLICAAIIAVLNIGWWGHGVSKEAGLVVRSLLFWPPGPWVSGQIWTLPIEIAFYAVVWLMIAAGIHSRLEALAWTLGILSCSFWLAQELGLTVPGGFSAWLLLQHGIYFALGITLISAGTNGFNAARALLTAICCLGAWIQIAATTFNEAPAAGSSPLLPFVFWLGACLLIWASVKMRHPVANRLGSRLPLARTLRTIGLVTYPLYLVHLQPGGLVYAALLRAGTPIWTAVIAACLVAILLAVTIALVLEPPVHAFVKRSLDRLLGSFERLWVSKPRSPA